MRMHRVVALVATALAVAGITTAVARSGVPHPVAVASPRVAAPETITAVTAITASTTTLAPSTTVVAPAAPAPALAAAPVLPTGPVGQLGCPPPPPPSPAPPSPEPWHPSVLVPDAQLPATAQPRAWATDPRPAFGKGMWVWMWKNTEGGNADAVVARARRAGLNQLWVRVADSQSGFYAASVLAELVPKAHAAHLSVIGWGFPYLYDPVGDAAWTGDALDWRSPSGDHIDGYSADVERSSEGVMLTPRRVAVYFDAVRRRAGNRLVVATVYPPLDAYWQGRGYPFAAMAPYVDAFAPMIYWECTDPGEDARVAVERLATLRPVHLIGQAYDMAGIPGGRVNAPSAAETLRFLDIGKRSGAIGASFWVWNTMDAPQWGALSSYPWQP